MGLADLHIHTEHSWDGIFSVASLLNYVQEYTNLDVIAITDHDQISGALEGLDLMSRYSVEVIPGCEISTADGHLLAYYIHESIPAGLSLKETVLRVGELGGLCVAAHPATPMAKSLKPRVIREALQDPDVARVLVGIEVFNSGIFYPHSNIVAQALADSLPVAQVGNSDAHMLWMVGQGCSFFQGSTSEALRQALANHTTRAIALRSTSPFRKARNWLAHYTMRRLGWVS